MTQDPQIDRHRRAVDMIGHALILQDDPQVWRDLAFVLECRLTRDERAMIMAAVAKAAHNGDVIEVFDRMMSDIGHGSPLPVFEDAAADARWWAGLATPAELRAWLAACFAHLPARDQRAFVEAACRRIAA